MPGRGSAIGLSATGGLGMGGVGGSATSRNTSNIGQLYAQGPNKIGNMATHHWLWVLVFLEIAALFLLRTVVFKRYHAG